jgi:NADH-quinone oxidoreductase subunit G
MLSLLLELLFAGAPYCLGDQRANGTSHQCTARRGRGDGQLAPPGLLLLLHREHLGQVGQQVRRQVLLVAVMVRPPEPGRDLHAILTDAAEGRIDVLHLIGVDLARDVDEPALAQRALAKVGTVIAQDLAMTTTVAEHADIVLPAAATQERAGSYTNWEGRTQRFARAIDGPDLVQEDWEIVVQVAALLGHDLGFNDLDGIRREVERLGKRAQGHAAPDVALVTPGGPPPEDRLAAVLRPLLIDDGTMLAGATDLAATARPAVAVLNIADAADRGIADGDRVEVASDQGAVRLTAEVGTDVIPGAVALPATSTTPTVRSLAGDGGHLLVTVTPVADDAGERAGQRGEVA